MGHWGWLVITCWLLGDIVTFGLFIWGTWHAPFPEGLAGSSIWLFLFFLANVLFFLPFVAFHTEQVEHHREMLELESRRSGLEHERNELKTQLELRDPKLSGGIVKFIFGNTTMPDGVQAASVLMQIEIKNRGQPTIVRFNDVLAVMKDGTKMVGYKIVIDNLTIFDNDNASPLLIPGVENNPRLIISAADAIYNKTSVPITTGNQAVGWMWVLFRGIDRDGLMNSVKEFTVDFEDINGRHDTFVGSDLTPIGPASGATWYPGDTAKRIT